MATSGARIPRSRWAVSPLFAVMLLVFMGAVASQPAATPPPHHGASTTQPSEGTAATRPARAVNPHWSASGCRHCHQLADGKPLPIQARPVDVPCLGCHDGRRARQELHPIGRSFGSGQIVQPEGWPVPDGKLGCITCHDVRRACDGDRVRPTDNPAFLRGHKGPALLTFCSRCHVATEAHARRNPHHMVTKSKEPMRQACQFCHDPAIFEFDRTARTGRPTLRRDEMALCPTCHNRHVDYFEPGHVGIRVPAEMKAYMAAAEWTGAGQAADAEPVQEALSAGDGPTRLPLTNENRVTCSTCHNPHEDGLFPADSVLGYGAMQHGEKRDRLRLRGLGKEVCRGCHNL